jgi:hypothetical protein
MATGTWGTLTSDADEIKHTLYMIDASGDRWTEDLYTAITATLAAIQAWLVLYQTVTQASVWKVERAFVWEGAMDTTNADFGARFEVKNGINLSFRDSATEVLNPLRVVAPETGTMQGTTDIPVPNSAPLSDLITATIGINPTFAFQTAQYTIHRERRGNPKVG